MDLKKKKTKLGEMDSSDLKGGPSQKKEVSNSTLIPDAKKADNGKIGPYPTFGESKTRSLGRAMQEQATKEAGQALAEKMTDEALKRMKNKKK